MAKDDAAAKRPKRGQKLTGTEIRKSSSTSMMMINCCVGAALLTLSYRFARLGLPLGIIYLTLPMVFSFWAYRQINLACYYSNAVSIKTLVEACWGRVCAYIVDVGSVLMIFGVLVVYCIIASDYVHMAYDLATHTDACVIPSAPTAEQCVTYDQCISTYNKVDMIIRVIMGMVVFLAESFLSSVNALNAVSSFALIFVLVVIVSVAVRVGQAFVTKRLPSDIDTDPWTPPDRIPVIPTPKNIVTDLPSFFTLFSLQSTIPPLFGEMKMARESRLNVIKYASYASTFIVYILYLVMALLGAVTFYAPNQAERFQKDNILSDFPTGDILMTVMRIGYGLVVIISFPVILFMIRAALMGWFGTDRKAGRKGCLTFYLSGVAMCVIVTILAVFVPTIVTVFDVISAIFGLILYQIMPLLVSVKLPILRSKCNYYDARQPYHEEAPNAIEMQAHRKSVIGVLLSIGQTPDRVSQTTATLVRRMSATQERRASLRAGSEVGSGSRRASVFGTGRRRSSTRRSPSSVQDGSRLLEEPDQAGGDGKGFHKVMPHAEHSESDGREGGSQRSDEGEGQGEEALEVMPAIPGPTPEIAIANRDYAHMPADWSAPKISIASWVLHCLLGLILIAWNLAAFVYTIIDIATPAPPTACDLLEH